MLDMAKDAARVLDALGWHDAVHLVGVSMGGMVAQELALHQPDRFATLSLLATHAGGFGAILPRLTGIAHFLAVRVGPAKKRQRALARLLYPKSFLSQCDRAALAARMDFQLQQQPPRKAIRRQMVAIYRHDTRKRLAAIRIPTLIIKPEKDILVHPRHSDSLARAISHASVLRLPDAGHGLIYQSAVAINQRLLEHFGAAPTRE
jgi:pimeloyl-ACP methyl ester carboxylesterase